uniref:hypothetical protein n=1 Tax=Tessaracoccus bendigoensis TaxID=72764 RepID=UPI000932D2D0|nr:hypothetical protein [Tessaracoccus bendigoensis]
MRTLLHWYCILYQYGSSALEIQTTQTDAGRICVDPDSRAHSPWPYRQASCHAERDGRTADAVQQSLRRDDVLRSVIDIGT